MLLTSFFSFSHNVFKGLFVRSGLCGKELTLYSMKILILTYQLQAAFENIAGKEEIARNKQFLPFPQFFST